MNIICVKLFEKLMFFLIRGLNFVGDEILVIYFELIVIGIFFVFLFKLFLCRFICVEVSSDFIILVCNFVIKLLGRVFDEMFGYVVFGKKLFM